MMSQDFWVMIEAVATSVLAIAAVIALAQLRWAKQSLETAKKDIEIRSHREALALAAELCEKYGAVTIPYCTHEFEELRRAGPFAIHETREVKIADTSFVDRAAAEATGKAMCRNPAQLKHACNILNRHEGLALYFCSGAADEEVAFPVISALFYDKVHSLLPILIEMRRGAKGVASGPFENTVKLYERWAAKLKKMESDAQTQGVSTTHTSPKGTRL